MEKARIFIEIYKGLLNKVVSTVDAEIYVLTDDSKAKTLEDIGKWAPLILVRNEQEFHHITKKIISR